MSNRRRSIEIPGVAHSAPIPMGTRVANLVFSSAIMGADPTTGMAPDDGRSQVRLTFSNLRSFLDAAGCTPDDVARVDVLLADNELRSAVNEEWLSMFPDGDSRPARHTTVHPLAGNFKVQVEVIAVAK